jgi:hypothetical protein
MEMREGVLAKKKALAFTSAVAALVEGEGLGGLLLNVNEDFVAADFDGKDSRPVFGMVLTRTCDQVETVAVTGTGEFLRLLQE